MAKDVNKLRILTFRSAHDATNNLLNAIPSHGHCMKTAISRDAGLRLATTSNFEAAIIPFDLDDIYATKLCKQISLSSNVSIIMVSVEKSLTKCLASLEAGADDFLTLPIDMSEVLIRLEAIVSRRHNRAKNILKVSDLEFNLDTLEIRRGETMIRTTPISLKLLEIMMKRSPSIVNKKDLEEIIWGRDEMSSDNLRANIYLLRKKIDKGFNKPLIHTAHGHGYKVSE